MRYAEIDLGIRVSISNEEADFMNKFHGTDQLFKVDLTDRECVLANKLVHKAVINRRKSDGQLYYIKNQPSEVRQNAHDTRRKN